MKEFMAVPGKAGRDAAEESLEKVSRNAKSAPPFWKDHL
jgi:hypothetical protein